MNTESINGGAGHMKNVIIWGAGWIGRILYQKIKEKYRVLFFVDKNHINITDDINIPVYPPSHLQEANDFDEIIIASSKDMDSIFDQLVKEFGVPAKKINRLYSEYWQPLASIQHPTGGGNRMRVRFLKEFAVYAHSHNIKGNVAEVGVFRGEFAKEINSVFYDRRLFLFDTFGGFDERDLSVEKQVNPVFDIHDQHFFMKKDLPERNIKLVLEKMQHPENCIIKKGYFPETFDNDMKDEKFVFVNLDPDLYRPIKEGLEIFYPKMSKGGVILIHNYFDTWLGAAKAVDEYIHENGLTAIPIGDYSSIAIIKVSDTV